MKFLLTSYKPYFLNLKIIYYFFKEKQEPNKPYIYLGACWENKAEVLIENLTKKRTLKNQLIIRIRMCGV